MRHFTLALAAIVLALSVAIPAEVVRSADEEPPAFDAPSLEFFEREVRPILVERCFECHGASSEEPKGGLRLDSRALAIAGGDTGPALVPGDAASSLLVDAINYGELYQMPPKSRLPAREVEALTRWVEMGAPWPREDMAAAVRESKFDLQARKAAHWCWTGPVKPPVPQIRDRSWIQQDLDAFVLARLEKEGLQLAPRADRATLLRRAYFDLIGLPPSPAQVRRFQSSDSPQAFVDVVDELLDSPHFGERWARHWLDLVRYAETHGHEFDYPIHNAHRYRDYVIRALNADLPYNDFVVEHVAGDLLDPPRRHPTDGFNESILGTGFWWFGEATHSPVDVRDDEARRIDNQIDVLTKTFLGLTVSCARCHDHKFDAISTKDYYSLVGFLKSSHRQEAYLDHGGQLARTEVQVQQKQAAGSRILLQGVLNGGLDAAGFASGLLTTLESERSSSEAGEASSVAWVKAMGDPSTRSAEHPLHAWWLVTSSASGKTPAESLALLEKAAETADTSDATLPTFTDFSSASGYRGWFQSGMAFGASPTTSSQWNPATSLPQFHRPGVAHSGRVAEQLPGVLRSPTFTLSHPNLLYRIAGGGGRVRLILDGYYMDEFNPLLFRGFSVDIPAEDEFQWHRQAADVGRYVGHRAHLEIIDSGDGTMQVDEIRFSDGADVTLRPSRIALAVLRGLEGDSLDDLAGAYAQQWEAALQAAAANEADAEQIELVNWALRNELCNLPDAARSQLTELREQINAATAQLPALSRAIALGEGTAENERVFIRGNYKTLGPEAPRQLLEALGGGPELPERGSGRPELARRLVDPQNPLVARVLVNRLWHHLMGRGIVASVDNFGVLGQRPTHPELLDHLAIDLIEQGWSLKSMIRTIMLSSTYQMSSVPHESSREQDPANLLLAQHAGAPIAR